MNLIPSSTDEKQFVKWAKNIIQQSHFSKQSTILNWRIDDGKIVAHNL